MYIVLLAETMKRADEELFSLVEENREALSKYCKAHRYAVFEDYSLVIQALSLDDLVIIKSSSPDQIFCTKNTLGSEALDCLYHRVRSRHIDIPEDFIIQILGDEREINYEN